MIVEERQIDTVRFGEIKPGAVFRANGSIWLKTHSYLSLTSPAVNVATGQWWLVTDDDERVQHIPQARLVVTP